MVVQLDRFTEVWSKYEGLPESPIGEELRGSCSLIFGNERALLFLAPGLIVAIDADRYIHEIRFTQKTPIRVTRGLFEIVLKIGPQSVSIPDKLLNRLDADALRHCMAEASMFCAPFPAASPMKHPFALRPIADRREYMRALARLAHADKTLRVKELRLLWVVFTALGLPEMDFVEIMRETADADDDLTPELVQRMSPDNRLVLLHDIMSIADADGQIGPQERQFVCYMFNVPLNEKWKEWDDMERLLALRNQYAAAWSTWSAAVDGSNGLDALYSLELFDVAAQLHFQRKES